MTLSKWIAVAASVKKLASRGIVERTLNYINDAASIAGHVREISQSIESFMVGTHFYRSCPD
jgi:hypothetical protein